MKLTGREKDQNWAKVNQRAVQMNQKVDRESYKVQKEADARKAAGEKEKFNPYARRKVKPKILWEVGQAKDDDDNAEEKKHTFDGTPSTVDGKEPCAATPALVPETLKVTALSDSHQFAIDEEGLVQTSLSTTGLGFGSKTPRNLNRVRKGLRLAEYFERKENGTL
jgi:RNA polymerase-associated protein RTF1